MNGPFFANPEIRGCFTGIEKLYTIRSYKINQPAGFGGNSTHALHAVEQEALKL